MRQMVWTVLLLLIMQGQNSQAWKNGKHKYVANLIKCDAKVHILSQVMRVSVQCNKKC